MEIQIDRLRDDFQIQNGTVVHAGANLCQERDLYRAKGIKSVVWIEGIPSVAAEAKIILRAYENQSILEAALWSESNISLSFNVTSNRAESSSLLDLKLHKAVHPSIEVQSVISVSTVTLDEINRKENGFPEEIFLLVMDLQGAEFEVLKGAGQTLKSTHAIHIEVSTIELYRDQKLFGEIHKFLTAQGFILVTHDLSGRDLSGDALYVQKAFVTNQPLKPLPDLNPRLRLNWRGRLKFWAVTLGIPAKYFGLPGKFLKRFRKSWRNK